MKYSNLIAAAILLAIGLSACERKSETTVVQPVPVPVPAPAAVPGPPGPSGPAGPTGATGASGEPGKPGGDTVVVIPPAGTEKK